MLPAGGRQHCGCIIPQAVAHSLMLLKMAEIIARNMLLIGIINKPLLLHVVDWLYYSYKRICSGAFTFRPIILVYWGYITPSVDLVALNIPWSWAVISKWLLSLAWNARVLSGTIKRRLLQFCFLERKPFHQIFTHRWANVKDFYCCFPHSLKLYGSLQLSSTFSHSIINNLFILGFLIHICNGRHR